MPYLDSVQALLEAKEGEHVQFREAKNRFDFGEAAKCCCALANNGGGKLVFGITDMRPRRVVGKRVLVLDAKSRPIGMPVQYDGVAWIYGGEVN